jgi:ABC-type multidrug transport system fused ATPase/permease subunit
MLSVAGLRNHHDESSMMIMAWAIMLLKRYHGVLSRLGLTTRFLHRCRRSMSSRLQGSSLRRSRYNHSMIIPSSITRISISKGFFWIFPLNLFAVSEFLFSSDARLLPPKHPQGNIELQNVKFRYPARPDAVVFDNLDLSIQVRATACSPITSSDPFK